MQWEKARLCHKGGSAEDDARGNASGSAYAVGGGLDLLFDMVSWHIFVGADRLSAGFSSKIFLSGKDIKIGCVGIK